RAARRAASGRLLDGAAAPGCLGTQPGDRRLEVLERVEALVDAREAEVGDEVQLLERLEDRQPHLVGVDLREAAGADALLDALGPAPGRRAVVRCAGVDDAGVGIATERAVHPPRIAARGPLSGSPAPRPAAR